MKSNKQMYLIILFVFLMGLFIQGARIDLFFSMSSMKNTHIQPASKVIDNYTVPQSVKSQTNIQENFLVLYDPMDKFSVAVKKNVCAVLKYMKKPFRVIDARQIGNISIGDYGTVLVAMNNLDPIADINKLIYYTGDGGKVFFAACLEDSENLVKIYRKLGIFELGNCSDVNGIKLLQNVLIGAKGFTVSPNSMVNYSRFVGLEKSCTVYAVFSKDVPMLWSTPYGQGKFMVFNGSTMDRKDWRGILVGGISLLDDDFIYPVFNFKLAFIDDFPTPFPTNTDPKIMKEYHRNLPNFYYEIWWPDVLASSSQNNIIYNGAVIETYNDQVKPPFKDLKNQNKNNLITYGREIIKSGGEMGIHGYNHQPLAEPGYITSLPYNPWVREEYMMAGIKEALDFASSVYPNYEFRLYVPPSNIISPLGMQALRKSMPGLRVISSVYAKDEDNTEAYAQEFEIDKNGIAQIPRISAGYTDHDGILWNEYNSITSLGVFSHFIHPDDVLSEDRSVGWSWENMYDQYDRILRQIKRFYWLRSMTASQAAAEVEKLQNAQFYYARSENSITGYCENMTGEMYFIIRTDKKLKGEGCTVSAIDKGIYLVKAEKPKFELLYNR